MNQSQLEYFISVAKYRNFTKAASEFYISQPALSHQINALEKELDCQLFIRNTRSVTLTPGGELFLEDAKRIVTLMDEAKQRIALADSQPQLLRIAYLAAPTHTFLPEVVYHFRQAHPNIRVKLLRMDAMQISESAIRKECDFYFSVMSDLTTISDLHTKKIHSDSLCLVTRKDHPALEQIPLDYSKIASEPFLMFNPERAKNMNDHIQDICKQMGYKPRIIETYDLYEALLEDIKAGVGISILPYRSSMFSNMDLAYTRLDTPHDGLDTGIAWHVDVTNAAVPLFRDFFRKFIHENPDLF